MQQWFETSNTDRKAIIQQASVRSGIRSAAVEKDLWVVFVLKAVFETSCAPHLVFKGGTSLSKCWNIIERFSEDVDLGIERSFFGQEFNGHLSSRKINKLRDKTAAYVQNDFKSELNTKLQENGVRDYSILPVEEGMNEPTQLQILYNSLIEPDDYLKPRVLLEIGSRSLREPFEYRELHSIIGAEFPQSTGLTKSLSIPTVSPGRTLLEKMFLLHEEFQKKEIGKIKHQRMSRHLYDISRLASTAYYREAIEDNELYETIVAHRSQLNRIGGVDYSLHKKKTLSFVPPDSVRKLYASDYGVMRESMIYGDPESFDKLIDRLTEINTEINSQ
ncbi:MAG: nucleotidyl transferase AbiEii/AbiGii toxin family protein [Bacteroidia bacterium]|jgi:hypothetical protein|nr:nucleotidyl transferase AbiEii/AbiGii toxin family protein [Bacteroidia bacterium]